MQYLLTKRVGGSRIGENFWQGTDKIMVEERIKETVVSEVEYSRSQIDQILHCALDIARKILESGGEIRRAEETVEFICHAYGIKDMEVFGILSEIQATIRTPKGRYITQIVRVQSWMNDLYRLELLNALSRKICQEKPDPSLLQDLVSEIAVQARPHQLRILVSYFAGAAGFCVFFGGSFHDSLVSGIIGLVVYLLDFIKPKWMNSVAHGVIASAAVGILCFILTHFGIGQSMEHIMMGTIMLLTPGLALGNAIRDLLCGDLIAGSLRMMQVLLAAAAITAGLVVTIWLGGVLF
jgi:uncharacterized membrane protein YjjP (DUF1212 family)